VYANEPLSASARGFPKANVPEMFVLVSRLENCFLNKETQGKKRVIIAFLEELSAKKK
jgi:hypothetical protein